jgi:hypothetical protein
MLSQIGSASVTPILLFYGEFASGTVRMWSGIGDLSWDSQTWLGAGNLVQVSNIEETSEIKASGIVVTFNGIPADLLSLVLTDVRQGALGRIYLGFLSSGSVVATPWLIFEGRIDTPVINEEAETCSIAITYESRLIDLSRPRTARYTDQDQKREFPDDLGMEFILALQDKEIPWGRAGNNVQASTPDTSNDVVSTV